MEANYYIAHWWYSDKSSSGILPKVLSESEKELIELASEYLEFSKQVEFIKVKR